MENVAPPAGVISVRLKSPLPSSFVRRSSSRIALWRSSLTLRKCARKNVIQNCDDVGLRNGARTLPIIPRPVRQESLYPIDIC